MKTFEDLIIWQDSRKLVNIIYKTFAVCKDFGFRDQLQRASVSIMNNIAEGYERNSKQQLTYFFNIAKGSIAEVRSMMYIAYDLGYITDEQFQEFTSIIKKLGAQVQSFIKQIS